MKTQLLFARRFGQIAFILILLWSSKPSIAQGRQKQWLSEKFSLENYLNSGKADSLNQPPQPTRLEVKSENRALAWSFFGTFAPILVGIGIGISNDLGEVTTDRVTKADMVVVLISSGVFIGPSLGYFYGGLAGRGLLGISIRAGFGLAGLALAPATDDCGDSFICIPASVVIGTLGVAASTVYDIASVKRAVRKHNRSLGEKALVVTPAYFAKSGAAGIQMQIKF